MTPQKFVFTPNAADTDYFKQRLANPRVSPSAPDPQGKYGIDPVHLGVLAQKLADLDWQDFARRVNAFAHFTVAQDGETLHFIHERSAQAGAIPLLLLHGWPGSFVEFMDIIPKLTTGSPAFHVVCPSLPGYGFSSRDLTRLTNGADVAAMMVKLMRGLGYDRFVVQGGDWGSIVGTEVGRNHPDACMGLHLNLIGLPPPDDEATRTAIAPEEATWMADAQHLMAEGMGYFHIQSTKPQTLSFALGDSPYGTLAWIAEKFVAWSDKTADGASLIPDEKVIENVAIYLATNSIGSSVRMYYDVIHKPAPQTRVTVPTGVALFPKEIIKAPRAWAAKAYNLVHWEHQARGGHFAALEVPDLLMADLRAFTRKLTP